MWGSTLGKCKTTLFCQKRGGKNGTNTISPPNRESQNLKFEPMNPALSSLTPKPNPCLPNPYEPRPPHRLCN